MNIFSKVMIIFVLLSVLLYIAVFILSKLALKTNIMKYKITNLIIMGTLFTVYIIALLSILIYRFKESGI